jgi:hypothetical protein
MFDLILELLITNLPFENALSFISGFHDKVYDNIPKDDLLHQYQFLQSSSELRKNNNFSYRFCFLHLLHFISPSFETLSTNFFLIFSKFINVDIISLLKQYFSSGVEFNHQFLIELFRELHCVIFSKLGDYPSLPFLLRLFQDISTMITLFLLFFDQSHLFLN